MRAQIVIQGLVQGVGYRFFVVARAQQYHITGYVQNLPNGNVRVVAEGDKGVLLSFIEDLRIGPASAHITAVDVQWNEEESGFTEFEVKF